MDKREYQWLVELVQDRYEYLKLTFEQAEQVYQYEQVVAEPAGNEFLPRWEELDFELATMRRILSAEQFTLFLVRHSETREAYVEQLRKMDTAELPELGYCQAVLVHYQMVVLPTLHVALELEYINLPTSEHRLQFMWEEYQQYLQERWKSIVARHYRNYRSFGAKELELQRLNHEILKVWPRYDNFVAQLDKPARAVVKAVIEEADFLYDIYKVQLKEQEQKFVAFFQHQHKLHYGPLQGYIHYDASSEKQQRRQWVFTLIWLSRNAQKPLKNDVAEEPTEDES